MIGVPEFIQNGHFNLNINMNNTPNLLDYVHFVNLVMDRVSFVNYT